MLPTTSPSSPSQKTVGKFNTLAKGFFTIKLSERASERCINPYDTQWGRYYDRPFYTRRSCRHSLQHGTVTNNWVYLPGLCLRICTDAHLLFIPFFLLLSLIFIHDPVSIFNGSLNNLLDSLRTVFICVNSETLSDCMSVMLLDIFCRKLLTTPKQVAV